MTTAVEAVDLEDLNRPTDFHRVFLFSGTRGTVRGGGEGRAQGGVILKETGSETCDRRGDSQTGTQVLAERSAHATRRMRSTGR